MAPTLGRKPPPPLPVRDANGQPITQTNLLVAAYDPELLDSSDRCLQHMAVKGDVARHDREIRAIHVVLGAHSEKLAAIKPWIGLLATFIGGALVALLTRLLMQGG